LKQLENAPVPRGHIMKTSNKAELIAVDNGVIHEDMHYSRLKDAAIMMVDDEPIMLEIIQVLLEDAGYRNFIAVERSSQSIEMIKKTNPDVLLLDLDMPEINGYEILSSVRSSTDYQHLPVIILTASTEPEDKLKALELGATDFLSKPVDSSELVLRVRNTLYAKVYQDQLANYDSLTGLPNLKLFIERLGWGIELSKRERVPLMVLEIGLDKFRQINETLGMYTGDEVLLTIAERLNTLIRSSDFIGHTGESVKAGELARIGGHEFSIILSGANSIEAAYTVSKRILDAVRQPIVIDEHEIFMTASIGISVCPTDGEDVESLIKHAGSAKDFSRRQGSNNYQFFSSEMNDQSKERIKMESNLRKALDNNEFELYYQPKINSETQKLVGMECLLRWNHAEQGFISPEVFIPAAEELGLIVPIGDWVLAEACQTTSEWVRSGFENLKLSVNVSPKQFDEISLKKSIVSAIESSGLSPHNLVLEITESMLMGDFEHHITLLQHIVDLGVAFSLDDFGTGYSSLSYLKKFPIDELKIDRSFLTNVPEINEDNSIVKAIISMAHSLGMNLIAEGVESAEQLEFLRQHNCNIIQGFYYSKPLDKADFTEFLTRYA
jgi:diguanylate cyclase (GGDEF)-like protein